MVAVNVRAPLALAATALALVIAGCGASAKSPTSGDSSSAPVSPSAYVTALCRAVAPFEKDVATRSSALNKTTASSLAGDKANLVAYLGALSRDSSAALGKLKSAGVPRVTHGSSFAAEIISTFSRVNTALSRSQTLATNLSTTSASAFSTEATKLATAVKTSLGELGSGFKKTASNATLNAAAAKVPACHTL